MVAFDRHVINLFQVAFIGLLVQWGLEKSCSAAEPSIDAVKLLIASKCLACHDSGAAKGRLDLTSRELMLKGGESGPALVANPPQKSLIWQRVRQNEMPPRHPLADTEKNLIEEWILKGAPWSGGPLDPLSVTSEHRAGRDWWSLQPIRDVHPPVNRSVGLRRQPIDDFIARKLEDANLSMSSEADRRVLIRRLSFDLLGLPPAPEEVEQFALDDHPDAYERLVDRLLAAPHYGERWARHWLDVVRFGESNGFERDLPRPNAWQYRDWLIQALNRDMPYDEFVRWQLAGDLLFPDTVDAAKAVGFLVAGPHDTVVPVFDSMRAAMRQDELEDIVGTVGQTFLGLTVNCARCHDHKFDPISTREYYQLASALSGIDHGEREIIPDDVTRELNSMEPRINELAQQLREQTSFIHQAIIAGPASSGSRATLASKYPAPIAAWDFTQDLNDHVGQLHVTLIGPAELTALGIVLSGAAFGQTAPLGQALTEKTLEVRVRLRSLQQAGGGAMTVQSLSGRPFDSIVFGEQEPGKWLAGSNGFQRTLSFEGPVETSADKEVVIISLVYRADGAILGYRNGEPYGHSIRKDAVVTFAAGQSQILFGLRHGTEVGASKMLSGTIVGARLYDRALSPDEVSVSADSMSVAIFEAELLSRLTSAEIQSRQSSQRELFALRRRRTDLTKNGTLHIYSAIATQPSAMRIHHRGSVLSLGEPVSPGGLVAIQGPTSDFGLRPDAIEAHRRRSLANWITDARNPLFVRTMVNRIWHYHFGAGLVESPNDLGFHGGQPSHPELLEWMSDQFRSYSMKRLHRLIVTSAAYRQSSALRPSAAKIDSANRLLWRCNPRRLEAEEVRDAMLAVAGELNSQVGGQGYRDVNSYFFKGTQFYDPIDPPGYENQRRTVYRMWARGGRSPFLDTFDCPDPSTITPRRSSTVTPLQALSLLNHSFSLRMAESFADRLRHECPGDVPRQIQMAFLRLYGREPDREERELSREFIAQSGLAEFCRALWNTSEFLYLD